MSNAGWCGRLSLVSLQKIMLQSGVSGKPVVFLFTDTQIVSESFLEDINNVLNTGEVPNLWQVDELNKIIEDLRKVAVEQVCT
jgi:dynein heavy chain